MKKVLLTLLTVLGVSSAMAQVSAPDAKIATARKSVLQIQLSTADTYRDLQFDLCLPGGITASQGGVVKDAATGHVVAYEPVTVDGADAIRFVVVDAIVNYENQDATSVTGDYGKKFGSGVLVEIPVDADNSFTETAQAFLKNVNTSDDNGNNVSVESSNFDIEWVLLGDVNANNIIDIADAVAVVNNVTGKENEVFVREAADVNGNATSYDDVKVGEIADAVAIVNLVVGKTDTESGSAKANNVEVTESIEDTLDPQ